MRRACLRPPSRWRLRQSLSFAVGAREISPGAGVSSAAAHPPQKTAHRHVAPAPTSQAFASERPCCAAPWNDSAQRRPRRLGRPRYLRKLFVISLFPDRFRSGGREPAKHSLILHVHQARLHVVFQVERDIYEYIHSRRASQAQWPKNYSEIQRNSAGAAGIRPVPKAGREPLRGWCSEKACLPAPTLVVVQNARLKAAAVFRFTSPCRCVTMASAAATYSASCGAALGRFLVGRSG